MRRREFIKGIGLASGWPLAVRAQQAERIGRVSVLVGGSETDSELQSNVETFVKSLQNLGWISGRNLVIEYRWRASDAGNAQAFARELLRGAPDVVLAVGTAPVTALRDATRTIPIVFTRVSDPVEQGYVVSLAKPGGNVTGFVNFEPAIGTKWLEILKEVAPGVTRVLVMGNPVTSALGGFFRSIMAASASLAIEPVQAAVHSQGDIESAITTVCEKPGAGLIVIPDGFLIANRETVLAQVSKYRLPATYPFRSFVTDGGLVSYGTVTNEEFRGAASYVDRILRGEKPAGLPVQEPTKFELVINLKTAKAMGLTIPESMLLVADEVIE